MKLVAQLAIQGDYGQVRQLATEELVKAKDEGGRTVLMLAADTDFMTPPQFGKCIEYFMHLGADPSAADTLGDTAAHLAARRDHLRLLALLPFEAKWQRNGDDFTPLMDAAQAGSWKCAKHLLHLLRQWRYKEKRLELLGMKSRLGRTALDLARDSGHSELVSIIEQ